MSELKPIRPKLRDKLWGALAKGLSPTGGLQHVAVVRDTELKIAQHDFEQMKQGASAIRFIIGEYGAGKTFFLQYFRYLAHRQGLVTTHAELDLDVRLYSTKGQARALYRQLTRNLSTPTMPGGDGRGLLSVVETFIAQCSTQAAERGVEPSQVIMERCRELTQGVGGFDFAKVVAIYCEAHASGDIQRQMSAERWLRGEYEKKRTAAKDLGVEDIVDDDNYYDFIKLLAHFIQLAGFSGFLVCIDEFDKLREQVASVRKSTYGRLLTIVNDCTQGDAKGLGFLFGCTTQSVFDPKTGVFTNRALETRLRDNGASLGNRPVRHLVDLPPFDAHDFRALCAKLRHIQAGGKPESYVVDDAGIEGFLDHHRQRNGQKIFMTTRDAVRACTAFLEGVSERDDGDWRAVLSGEAAPSTPRDAFDENLIL